ncbi:hypothetical protein B0T10DRAFT_588124 [Thelonectria olida]|uniref:BHLH domain-containing protein n=1 Tax=Thelonectria olida TaxID=1576542 RepID=A0A9P9AFS1_9HYPO|nr:hypothetical protein B0T10DRAFT_588124 [Thelonectria olida]
MAVSTMVSSMDLALSSQISEDATFSDMSDFPPPRNHPIPGSGSCLSADDNCSGKSPAEFNFNETSLSLFQNAPLSSPEPDRFSSHIVGARGPPDFSIGDTSMDILESMPLDLCLVQPTYGGPTMSNPPPSVQPAAFNHACTASHSQSSGASSPERNGVTDSSGSSVGDDKEIPRQLRTASRKPENASRRHRSTLQKKDSKVTFAQKRARDCHNETEKRYRDRLNSQYTALLNMIPLGSQTIIHQNSSPNTNESQLRVSRSVSRGEILDAARNYIQTLEQTQEVLRQEKEQLTKAIETVKARVQDQDYEASDFYRVAGIPNHMSHPEKILQCLRRFSDRWELGKHSELDAAVASLRILTTESSLELFTVTTSLISGLYVSRSLTMLLVKHA